LGNTGEQEREGWGTTLHQGNLVTDALMPELDSNLEVYLSFCTELWLRRKKTRGNIFG
jgi:hypothetical protein